MIIVHTGPGKGKTTAAIGLLIRSAGREIPAAYIGFMKGRESGEFNLIRKYLDDLIEVYNFGRKEFVGNNPIKEDYELADQAVYKARELLASWEKGLIVLDEINVALDRGLVKREIVEELITTKKDDVNLVMTGRGAPEWLQLTADTVTHFTEVKHHFQQGTPAKPGIEY